MWARFITPITSITPITDSPTHPLIPTHGYRQENS